MSAEKTPRDLARGQLPPLYLPIEIKSREFRAKLLLACHAAEAGFPVVLGSHQEFSRRLPSLPPGIYAEKAIHATCLHDVLRDRVCGNRVVAWCEEGLNIFNHDFYGRVRVSPEVVSHLDRFFAWGANQAEAVATAAPSIAPRTVLAGNPRFDVLRPPFRQALEPSAQRLRDEYGPFLLVNTNFAIFNNYFSYDFFLAKKIYATAALCEDLRDFLHDWYEYTRETFERFKAVVRRLGREFPELRIIVRPHPSENRENWERATEGLDNVLVRMEGSAIPWILASRAMMHNNCTTGVEAYVLGKPVVSYRPVRDQRYAQELSNAVSRAAFDEDAAVAALREAMAEPEHSEGYAVLAPAAQAVVDRYVANLGGRFSCEIMVEALKDLAQRTSSAKAGGRFERVAPPLSLQTKLAWRLREFKVSGRAKLSRLAGGGKQDFAYEKHKFPGVDPEEIASRLEFFRQATGRFGNVRASRVSGSRTLFCVEA